VWAGQQWGRYCWCIHACVGVTLQHTLAGQGQAAEVLRGAPEVNGVCGAVQMLHGWPMDLLMLLALSC
jgi:hypothetical protein